MQTDPPRIFISYSRQDATVMRRLEERLKAAGAEVWVDHSGIRSGDNLPKRISDALEWCNILLLLWSASAKSSKWVEDEWTNAHSLGRRIIPCLVDETPRPGILASKVYVDFRGFENGLEELFHSLRLSQVLTASTVTTPPLPILQLRSLPQVNFFWDDAKKMLHERGFYDADQSKVGEGLHHEYEAIEREGQKLVIDHTTGLIWQQSGSAKYMRFADAEKYVQNLNRQKFAGYDDWRLPTLEEAMSLMEPLMRNGDLHIDQVFNTKQGCIWTADKSSAGVAWVVRFYNGDCTYGHINNYHVRAVR